MFRSSLPRPGLPAPAARLLRAVPRPAALALASAVTAAGLAGGWWRPGRRCLADVGVCAAGDRGRAPVTFPYGGQPGYMGG
jgi:hypothetical protein